jgi:hypothetical protein
LSTFDDDVVPPLPLLLQAARAATATVAAAMKAVRAFFLSIETLQRLRLRS